MMQGSTGFAIHQTDLFTHMFRQFQETLDGYGSQLGDNVTYFNDILLVLGASEFLKSYRYGDVAYVLTVYNLSAPVYDSAWR